MFLRKFWINEIVLVSVIEFLRNRTVATLSYMGNLGSLAFLFLFLQIFSGIVLCTWYIPTIDSAFDSISYIMRETFAGWFIRYLHVVGASFFFLVVYLHLIKNIYYCSFCFPKHFLWISGCFILVIMMVIAFFGYILPWGNMSYWASVVVTNVIAVLGEFGKYFSVWVLGGYFIAQHTLSKFFTLHYLLPFVLLFLVFIHFFLLHAISSSNPFGLNESWDYLHFDPYYKVKDFLGFVYILFIVLLIITYNPIIFMHAENFEEADNMHTPLHIVPEWYFLLFYGILRSVPSKLLGIFLVVIFFLLLFFLPFIYSHFFFFKTMQYSFFHSLNFCFTLLSVFTVTYLGGKPITDIYMFFLFWYMCSIYYCMLFFSLFCFFIEYLILLTFAKFI